MKFLYQIVLSTIIFLSIISAQESEKIISMVGENSIGLYLINPIGSDEFYDVYRKQSGANGAYELLTISGPIKAIIDPNEAKIVLGEDFEFIKRSLKAEYDFEVAKSLRSNTFESGILSLISNNAAKIGGRWFKDKNTEPNKSYEYKLVFGNAKNKAADSLIITVNSKRVIPTSPNNLKAELGNKRVSLSWEYPNWQGDYSDLGLRYNVYRSVNGSEFEKINNEIIIRDNTVTPEYIDLWLDEGNTYKYYVTILDPIKNESEPSNKVAIVLEDKTPPSTVQDLSSSILESSILLSWQMNPELDAAGYYVFRSEGLNKEFIQITDSLIELTKPYYIDSTAQTSIQYFYTVAAIDTANNKGNQSNPHSVYIEDKKAPDAPAIISYKVENSKVILNWTKVDARDLRGYIVYRGEENLTIPRITHDPIDSLNFIDTGYKGIGFPYGGKFIYKVSAIDKAGNESEKSSIIVEVPDVEKPVPPENFNAINRDGRFMEIYAGASSSLDASIYRIFRQEIGKKEVLINEYDSAPKTYKDTAISKGNFYTYLITVTDTAGNISDKLATDSILFVDSTPPPAPRNVIAKSSVKGISLMWSKVYDFDMQGFNVYRSNEPNGIYKLINQTPISETNYIDTEGAKNNYYRIKSVDTSGNESKYEKSVSAN